MRHILTLSEIRPLTSLRFIAALLVFLFHFLGVSGKANNLFQAIATEGYVGVTLFFVLSGFLIAQLYFDRVEDKRWSLGEYVARRIARVCPLYYFLLAIVFVIQLQNRMFSSKSALIHLTLTQGYFLKFWSHDIPTAWSLTVEMTFYLVAPLIFWLFWRLRDIPALRRLPVIMVLGVYLATIFVLFVITGLALQKLSIATGVVGNAGFMGGFEIAGTSTIQNTTIFFRIFEFAVGIWCAKLYTTHLKDGWWQKSWTLRGATILFFLSVGGIIVLQYLMNQEGGFYDRKGYFYNYPISLMGGVLILSLTRPSTLPYRLLSLPLPVYLGHISYSLFLIQSINQMTLGLQMLAVTLGLSIPNLPGANPLRALYLYTGMSLISAVLYETVEKYGGRFIMWSFHRLPSQRA